MFNPANISQKIDPELAELKLKVAQIETVVCDLTNPLSIYNRIQGLERTMTRIEERLETLRPVRWSWKPLAMGGLLSFVTGAILVVLRLVIG